MHVLDLIRLFCSCGRSSASAYVSDLKAVGPCRGEKQSDGKQMFKFISISKAPKL